MLLWGHVWYNNKNCRKKNQRTFSTASALVCNTNECVTQINVSHLVSTANRFICAFIWCTTDENSTATHTKNVGSLFIYCDFNTNRQRISYNILFFFVNVFILKRKQREREGDRELKEANFILDTIRFLIGKK